MSETLERLERRLRIVPGELELWTGCSWRRIGIKDTMKTVLCPCVARDGQPDIDGDQRLLELMVDATNALPELLRLARLGLASEAQRERMEG